MRSRSLTRIALRLLLGSGGASSGKNFSTSSSRLSFPSEMANPTAVEVKLLLSEYRAWGDSALYGAHQPSATTWPWRRSMKPCKESMFLSAASTKERTAEDETPCVSGVLRGSSAPTQRELLKATDAMTERIFTLVTSGNGHSESLGALHRGATGNRSRWVLADRVRAVKVA